MFRVLSAYRRPVAVFTAGMLTTSTIALCEEKKAFSPKDFQSFPIRKVTQLSPNTKAIEVALPSAQHEMGMTTASFVMVKGPTGEDGKFVARPYTPTNTNADKGYCELVIKTYPNGIVSNYVHSLKVGDTLDIKGPLLKFKYVPNMKKHIGMLAGGTGLTPMLQVIKEIVHNAADHTEISLVFANNTEDDILLKSELDALAKQYKNVKITYILSQPSATWKGETGFVSQELIKRTMPAPSDDNYILVCGPPGFMEAVSGGKTPDYKQGEVKGHLKALGYNENMVFKF